MDLMRQATLDKYGTHKASGPKERNQEGSSRVSHEEAEVGLGFGRKGSMASLKKLPLKKQQAIAELKAFKTLLDGKGKGDLGEASDLLPFFDADE